MVIWHVSRDLGLVENQFLWQIIIAVAGGLIFYASLGSGIFLKTLFSRLKREDENDRRRFYIKMGNYSLFLALSCFGLILFYYHPSMSWADFFKNDNAWESMAKNPKAVGEFLCRHHMFGYYNERAFFNYTLFWKLNTKQEFYWDFFLNAQYRCRTNCGAVVPKIWEFPPYYIPLNLIEQSQLNYPWVTVILSQLEDNVAQAEARLRYAEELLRNEPVSQENLLFLRNSHRFIEETKICVEILEDVARENTPHKRASCLLKLLHTNMTTLVETRRLINLEHHVKVLGARNTDFWYSYSGLDSVQQYRLFSLGVPYQHWGLISVGGFEFEGIPGYNSPVPELYSDLKKKYFVRSVKAAYGILSGVLHPLNLPSQVPGPGMATALMFTGLITAFFCYREAFKIS